MRRVIVSEFMTLDGVVESPEKWSLHYWNDEIQRFKSEELAAADALLLGRVTYEGFAAAWPKMGATEGEYAEWMNGSPKFVASTTLRALEWNNSHLIAEDIPGEVANLKLQSGSDILVFGSSDLVRTLRRHDLIDEYRLLVYPVVLGAGKRLFKDGAKGNMRLVDARELGSGVAALRYEPLETGPVATLEAAGVA